MIRQNLKLLFLIHLFIALVISGYLFVRHGFQLGASFMLGSGLAALSVGMVALSTWLTLAKKSIAWTVMIIVIKYAVLLGSIMILSHKSWFNSMGVGLGIASFIATALTFAVLQQRLQQKKEKT